MFGTLAVWLFLVSLEAQRLLYNVEVGLLAKDRQVHASCSGEPLYGFSLIAYG
jgi:hypothetical protein